MSSLDESSRFEDVKRRRKKILLFGYGFVG